jgi:hypothetical protein
MTDYKQKYLKYKNKYLDLKNKNLTGGFGLGFKDFFYIDDIYDHSIMRNTFTVD